MVCCICSAFHIKLDKVDAHFSLPIVLISLWQQSHTTCSLLIPSTNIRVNLQRGSLTWKNYTMRPSISQPFARRDLNFWNLQNRPGQVKMIIRGHQSLMSVSVKSFTWHLGRPLLFERKYQGESGRYWTAICSRRDQIVTFAAETNQTTVEKPHTFRDRHSSRNKFKATNKSETRKNVICAWTRFCQTCCALNWGLVIKEIRFNKIKDGRGSITFHTRFGRVKAWALSKGVGNWWKLMLFGIRFGLVDSFWHSTTDT